MSPCRPSNRFVRPIKRSSKKSKFEQVVGLHLVFPFFHMATKRPWPCRMAFFGGCQHSALTCYHFRLKCIQLRQKCSFSWRGFVGRRTIEAGGSFSLDSQDGDGYIVKIHFDDFAQSLLLCLLSFQLGNSTRETDDVISKRP